MRLLLFAVTPGPDPFLLITRLYFMSRHVRTPDVFKFVEPECLKIISGVGFYITFNENIIVSNSLVPNQSRRFVGHDLDPKSLKRTSGTFHLIILLIDALAVHRS